MGTATYVKICCPRCGEKDLNIIGDRESWSISRSEWFTTEDILDL